MGAAEKGGIKLSSRRYVSAYYRIVQRVQGEMECTVSGGGRGGGGGSIRSKSDA